MEAVQAFQLRQEELISGRLFSSRKVKTEQRALYNFLTCFPENLRIVRRAGGYKVYVFVRAGVRDRIGGKLC